MSRAKVGDLNPMFNKIKSKEFLAHMNKDRKGSNNPMYGKPKSEATLAKLRKKVFFIIVVDSLLNAMIVLDML